MVMVALQRRQVENKAEQWNQSVRETLLDVATVGFNWSQEQAPVDRGTLKQSAFPPEFRGEMVVWGYTAPYADKQEFGTPPFTPPLKPLAEWGKRKLGSREAGIAVWEKIQERGIEPKGFARAGRERQKEKVQTTRLQDNLDGL